MSRKSLKSILHRVFVSEKGERHGILALLPLLGVVAIFLHGIDWRRSDPELLEKADSILSGPPAGMAVEPGKTLFYFDPNTVTLEELCDLGFELRTAASIVKYRSAGKRFTSPEDLAMCYGVTLEKYRELGPYILIGNEFRAGDPVPQTDRREPLRRQGTRETKVKGVRPPAEPFDPNMLDAAGFVNLGFSEAQARTIVNFRNSIGGFRSVEQLGRCYAVSDEELEILAPYIMIDPAGTAAGENIGGEAPVAGDGPPETTGKVEINSADSAALRSVSGIGEVLVVRILDYRERLGGFVRVEQLAEIEGMTEANYERIAEQITVDSCNISKIDINFAPHKEIAQRLERHPYADAKTARKLLSARQLKGGWSNTGELVEDKIWSEVTAVKMAPYLVFRPVDN